MVDFDSENECIYLCNLKKLEAIHHLLLILQNLIDEVFNPTAVGRGAGGIGRNTFKRFNAFNFNLCTKTKINN